MRTERRSAGGTVEAIAEETVRGYRWVVAEEVLRRCAWRS